MDKKVSFTNVEIIPLSVLRYFMIRPLVLVIRSFVLVSVSSVISIELVTKRNRYICVSICNCLMFHMIDIGSFLMPISRPGLFPD